ncbi:hypothetical protein QBC35DRAFT_467667 [Podospora australis]|uniref:Uncharacterized protein n=1 Tax=Podospora australis TaxID=1536484 RepID=A0AAN6WMG5_9PEZI|nr:hypothetical protein QBC35DRAFT_467667 [Podospora australis]
MINPSSTAMFSATTPPDSSCEADTDAELKSFHRRFLAEYTEFDAQRASGAPCSKALVATYKALAKLCVSAQSAYSECQRKNKTLVDKCSALTRGVESSQATINRLGDQIDDLAEQKDEPFNMYTDATRDAESDKATIELLRSQMNDIYELIAKLLTAPPPDPEPYQATTIELQTKVTSLEERNAELINQHGAAIQAAESHQATIKDLQAKIVDMAEWQKTELTNQSNSIRDVYQTHAQHLRGELSRLTKTAEDHQATINVLNTQASSLMERNTELINQYVAAQDAESDKATIKELEAKVTNLEKHNTELAKKCAGYYENIAANETRATRRDKTIESQCLEIQALKDQVASLEQEKTSSRERVSALESEVESHRAKTFSLEKTLAVESKRSCAAQLKVVLPIVQAEMSRQHKADFSKAVSKKKAALELQIHELCEKYKAKLETAAQEKGELEEQVKTLEAEKIATADLLRQNSDLDDRNTQLVAEVMGLITKLADFGKELDETKKEHQEELHLCNLALDENKKLLAAKEAEIRELETTARETGEHQEQIKALEAEKTAAKDSLQHHVDQNSKLESKVKELNTKLADTNKELVKTKLAYERYVAAANEEFDIADLALKKHKTLLAANETEIGELKQKFSEKGDWRLLLENIFGKEFRDSASFDTITSDKYRKLVEEAWAARLRILEKVCATRVANAEKHWAAELDDLKQELSLKKQAQAIDKVADEKKALIKLHSTQEEALKAKLSDVQQQHRHLWRAVETWVHRIMVRFYQEAKDRGDERHFLKDLWSECVYVLRGGLEARAVIQKLQNERPTLRAQEIVKKAFEESQGQIRQKEAQQEQQEKIREEELAAKDQSDEGEESDVSAIEADEWDNSDDDNDACSISSDSDKEAQSVHWDEDGEDWDEDEDEDEGWN